MAKIPEFKTKEGEAEFWETHDTTEFVEELEDVAEEIVDKRKPKRAISIRLDPDTILLTKRIAARMGLGYQTLFRLWIMEGLSKALREAGPRPSSGVVFEIVQSEGVPAVQPPLILMESQAEQIREWISHSHSFPNVESVLRRRSPSKPAGADPR